MSNYVNDSLKNQIKEHLKRLMARREFNQTELAAVVGATFQSMQKPLRGDTWLTTASIFNIARVLDVSVGYFYEAPLDAALPGIRDIAREFSAVEIELLRVFKAFSEKDRLGLQRSVRAAVERKIDLHVAARVKAGRFHRSQVTQDVLAEKTKLNVWQVLRYENGQSKIGSGRLYDIAGVLRLPVTFFFEGLDDGPLPRSFKQVFTRAERALVMNFRYLTDEQKEDVMTAVRNGSGNIVWRPPAATQG